VSPFLDAAVRWKMNAVIIPWRQVYNTLIEVCRMEGIVAGLKRVVFAPKEGREGVGLALDFHFDIQPGDYVQMGQKIGDILTKDE